MSETVPEKATCEMCGDPMPPGEEMFKFHGYSGPCPKPIKPLSTKHGEVTRQRDELLAALKRIDGLADGWHGPAATIQDVARAAIAKAEGR